MLVCFRISLSICLIYCLLIHSLTHSTNQSITLIILLHSSKECQTIHWKTAHKSVCIILCAQSYNNSKQLSDLDVKQLKCVIKGKCNELKIKTDSDLDSKSKEELVTLGSAFFSLTHSLIHSLLHLLTYSLTYLLTRCSRR